MRFYRLRSARALLVVGVLCFLCGCGEDARGQLTLAIQTDMRIPQDVDEIRLEILNQGTVQFANTYEVGPNSNPIPTTVAVVAGEQTSGPLTIRLISRDGPRLRTLREVVTTIPSERNVMLRLPIQWLCDGQATEPEPGQVDSTCPGGETCVAGRCVTREVESDELPDFAPEKVFGGGSGEGDGTCIDTVACFADGVGVPVDDDCTVAAPRGGEGTNVAIVLALGDGGICGKDVCLIPLDEDPGDLPFSTGWTRDSDRLQLPEAVCERLASGKALGVAVTTSCETKTAAVPTCGPWSSVTTMPATFDAPAPADVRTSACPAPSDSERATACITLQPEQLDLLASDAELDGEGELVVEAYATADVAAAEPVARFNSSDPVSVDDLPVVILEDLPQTVYLRAGLFDNAREDFDSLAQGGAWIGGTAEPGALDTLDAVELEPGIGNELDLPLDAVRRIHVTVSLGQDVVAHDGADGPVWFQVYPKTRAVTGQTPVGGSSASACVDLVQGPVVVEGYAFGSGPHFVVAMLDDFNAGTQDAAPGSIAGSLLSGTPSADGGWDIPDVLMLDRTDYVGAISVTLEHAVDPGDPAPDAYACPGGSCSDGKTNGSETDLDCGGMCRPCDDGRSCAGPGDCASLVCDGTCVAAVCDDGVQNGQETDKDCGGGCDPCGEGLGCLSGDDCESGSCNMARCQPGT